MSEKSWWTNQIRSRINRRDDTTIEWTFTIIFLLIFILLVIFYQRYLAIDLEPPYSLDFTIFSFLSLIWVSLLLISLIGVFDFLGWSEKIWRIEFWMDLLVLLSLLIGGILSFLMLQQTIIIITEISFDENTLVLAFIFGLLLENLFEGLAVGFRRVLKPKNDE